MENLKNMAENSSKTCYICASTISECNEESIKEKNTTATRKILFKYLLKNKDKSKALYNTIANYVSKRGNEGSLCSVQFCTSCDQRAEKVGRLLLKLNTIQNKIDKEIYDTREKVAGASKLILKLPDTDSSDGSKRKRNIKFLSTLRKFQKCVGIQPEPSLSPSIRVESAQNDNDDDVIVIQSVTQETSETQAVLTISNSDGEDDDDFVKQVEVNVKEKKNDGDDGVGEDDHTFPSRHTRSSPLRKSKNTYDADKVCDQDLSHEEEEEYSVDCNPDHLDPVCSIDPLLSSEYNDSYSMDTTLYSSTPSPKGTSSNLIKQAVSRIQTSLQPTTTPRLIKVKAKVPSNKSRNIPNSSYFHHQISQPILSHQRNSQGYVIVTQLEPSSQEKGSLTPVPPPKLVPVELPPKVVNTEKPQKTINLQAPPRTIPIEPAPTKQIIIVEKPVESDSNSDSEERVEQTPSKISKSGKPVYCCKLCSFSVLNSKIAFEHHLRSHETAFKRYRCTRCPMKFTTKQMYDLHLKYHGDRVHHKCDICNKPERILRLKEHLSEVHKVEPISCPYCSYSFGKYYGLLSHWRWHANTPIKCVICPDSVFKTRKLLAQHFIEFHKIDEADVIFKCDKPECTQTFYEEYFKTIHMRRHEKTFECSVCGSCFSLAYELQRHSKTHQEKTLLYLCDRCPEKTFFSSTALCTHQRKEHDAPKVQCDQCERSFFSDGAFLCHKKRAHGDGNFNITLFPCPTCGKEVQSKRSLKKHMLAHSGIKDFVCSECGFRTSTKDLLKHHEMRHFGEKTHQCPYCPKVFLKSAILKIHVRVHTKERPYVCNICGADFNQSSAMTTHKRRHADTNFVPRAASKKTSKRSN